MSASAGRPGRPAGPDPETLAKGRLYLALVDYDTDTAAIAAREGVARSVVYRAMSLARAADAGAEQDGPVAPESEPKPRPPQRMSRRTAQSRAWEYAEAHLISAFGLAVNSFWVRLVVAVHEDGDGFCLPIGEPECRFGTRDDLADLFGRQEVDIHDWLEKLFQRGRLIDLDGQGIALPTGLGLVPGENSRGRKVVPRARQAPDAGKTPDPRNRTMLQVLTGGRSDSENINRNDSEKTPIYSESPRGVFSESDSEETGVSSESKGLARAASAAANTKKNQSLSSSSSTEGRARDSEKTPPDSEKTPLGDSEKTPLGDSDSDGIIMQVTPPDSDGIIVQVTALTKLVAELVELATPGRHPNPKDLRAFQGWVDKGVPVVTMRAVIETVRSRPNGARPTSLAYFDNAMDEAMKGAGRPPAAAVPASKPPPPRSEADLALDARLEALSRRRAELPAGPQIPLREGLDAACRTWKPADTLRWIAVVEGLCFSGLLGDVELPEFHDYVARPHRFEDQIIEAEEMLTRPSATS